MPDTICRLTANDRDELLAFLDHSFSLPAGHFAQLLPALYPATDDKMSCNYVIRRHGDIAANVGLFPGTLLLDGEALPLAGIGGVATGPQYRGQGLMKTLMDEVVAAVKADGYALSWLGGQRQRYGYWGYERAGREFRRVLSRANLRHALPGLPGVSLHAAEASDMDRIMDLHDSQRLRAIRPREEAALWLRSWATRPFVARHADGRVVGYLAGKPADGTIHELVAESDQMALEIIRAWAMFAHEAKEIAWQCCGTPTPLQRQLAAIEENCHACCSGNWLILDWARVIGASLRYRHRLCGLSEGQVALAIDDEVFALTVDGEAADCVLTDAEPLIRLGSFEAMRVLFGPSAPDDVMEIPADARLLRDWCPLPLSLPRQDHV